MNQKLAIRLLEKLGYRADVAGNGIEAIEALERQSYDLLLSDVQMPEMDGLEATRRIIERWPAGERPWIVAMTAEAMSGDRERCLEAGMNDYVTKPIRVARARAPRSNARPEGRGGRGCIVGRAPTANRSIAPRSATSPKASAATRRSSAGLIEQFGTDAPALLAAARTALADGDIESTTSRRPHPQVQRRDVRRATARRQESGAGGGGQRGRRGTTCAPLLEAIVRELDVVLVALPRVWDEIAAGSSTT